MSPPGHLPDEIGIDLSPPGQYPDKLGMACPLPVTSAMRSYCTCPLPDQPILFPAVAAAVSPSEFEVKKSFFSCSEITHFL